MCSPFCFNTRSATPCCISCLQQAQSFLLFVHGLYLSVFRHTAAEISVAVVNKSSVVAKMGDRLATIDMGRKLGGLCSFCGSCTHLTQCGLCQNLALYQVASWSIQPFGHNKHGPKICGGSAPFLGRGAGSLSNTVAWDEAYLDTKWHLDPSLHLAATDIGRKLGGSAPLGEGELGPHLTQCGQGWGLPACQVSSWSVQPFGHNTPTSQTWQDRQDRQRSDSIGRTVLQTVAQ